VTKGPVIGSLLALVALATVMTFAGRTLAAGQTDTFKLVANLKARSEVPRPTGVRPGASGLFTGTAVELANDKASLKWRLTFSKLTGRAAAAHIHIGKPGKAGNVLVALCGPCMSGKRGRATITHAQLKTIRAGRAYVNIHTAKNAAGEIRGQLKASETTSDGSPPPPAPPPSPEPPPPPPYP
jgi:CHRD domain